jgi:hypothetical protein
VSKQVADAVLLEGIETEFVAEAAIKGRETREEIFTPTQLTLTDHPAPESSANKGAAKWAGNPENVEVLSRNYRSPGERSSFDVLGQHIGFKRPVAIAAVAIAVLGFLSWLIP